MKTEYYIINPTGNITALVLGEHKKADYAAIGSAVMKKHNNVEQVGFVSSVGDDISINMCGGEFCGNATMSAAALAFDLSLKQGTVSYLINASGAEGAVPVTVKENNGGYICEISVKRPENIEEKKLKFKDKEFVFPVVTLGGISHIIVENQSVFADADDMIRHFAKELCVNALGMMFYNTVSGKLDPLVYVSNANTLFYENSCASGSCALCAYLSRNNADVVEYAFKQPGGTLMVRSSAGSEYVILRGKIKIEQHFCEDL